MFLWRTVSQSKFLLRDSQTKTSKKKEKTWAGVVRLCDTVLQNK